ncbi:hypothetical protein BFL35_07775 [Clavibacter michiganensis]|nr:hypothetical protein BFL35_07775 [Clavibacter michiganensis]
MRCPVPRRPDEAERDPLEQMLAHIRRARDRRRYLLEKSDRTPEEDAELAQALAEREVARQRRMHSRVSRDGYRA